MRIFNTGNKSKRDTSACGSYGAFGASAFSNKYNIGLG